MPSRFHVYHVPLHVEGRPLVPDADGERGLAGGAAQAQEGRGVVGEGAGSGITGQTSNRVFVCTNK